MEIAFAIGGVPDIIRQGVVKALSARSGSVLEVGIYAFHYQTLEGMKRSFGHLRCTSIIDLYQTCSTYYLTGKHVIELI